jgi:hypothetical protein
MKLSSSETLGCSKKQPYKQTKRRLHIPWMYILHEGVGLLAMLGLELKFANMKFVPLLVG